MKQQEINIDSDGCTINDWTLEVEDVLKLLKLVELVLMIFKFCSNL